MLGGHIWKVDTVLQYLQKKIKTTLCLKISSFYNLNWSYHAMQVYWWKFCHHCIGNWKPRLLLDYRITLVKKRSSQQSNQASNVFFILHCKQFNFHHSKIDENLAFATYARILFRIPPDFYFTSKHISNQRYPSSVPRILRRTLPKVFHPLLRH